MKGLKVKGERLKVFLEGGTSRPNFGYLALILVLYYSPLTAHYSPNS